MAEKNEVLKTNENIEMLEKNRNNKNSFSNWDPDRKNLIIKILISIGLVLCIFGIMDKIFEHTIFNFFKNLTMPYLEKTYEESKKMFLTLSLLKGTTDIIEGSTVNVSMIVGMEIEIGDIIQPIYDMINILWKVSLASVVILKLETIYYEIFKVKLATILTFISLITIFPYTIYKNKITEILKKISKYSFFTLLYIYIILPSAIFVNSTISSYFEKEYKEPAIVELNQDLNKLNKVKDEMLVLDQSKSIFNIPGQIDSAKAKIDNFSKEINTISRDLVENTPVIIGIILLSSIVLPVLIAVLLYMVTKSIIFEKINGKKIKDWGWLLC